MKRSKTLERAEVKKTENFSNSKRRAELVAKIWEPDLKSELVDRLLQAVDNQWTDEKTLDAVVDKALSLKTAYENTNGKSGSDSTWKPLAMFLQNVYKTNGATWEPTTGKFEPRPKDQPKQRRRVVFKDGTTADFNDALDEMNGATSTEPTKNSLTIEEIGPKPSAELLDDACQIVYIVDGDHAAAALNKELAGYDGERVATTAGGASSVQYWTKYAKETLSGKLVYVLADNDETARKTAERIAETVELYAEKVLIVDLIVRPDGELAPTGYDVANFLDELKQIDPSAIAALYLDGMATPYQPPQRNLKGTTAEELGLVEPSPVEQSNRDAINARCERERILKTERLLDEIAQETTDFPLDCLPDCLRGYVQEVSEKFHICATALGLGALSLIGSFAGYKFKLRAPEVGYDGLHPKTGILIVSTSGNYKSPLLSFLVEPIKEIEDANGAKCEQAANEHKQFKNVLTWNKKEFKNIDERLKRHKDDGRIDDDERKKLKDRLFELENTINEQEKTLYQKQEPIPGACYILKPVTPEGVKDKIFDNLLYGYRNGAIMASDEAKRVFSTSHGIGVTEDRLLDYGSILDGDDFKEYTRNGLGVGDKKLPGIKFAGVFFCIQTPILARLLQHPELREIGFFNRLVKIHNPYSRQRQTMKPISETAKKNYFKAFQFLVETAGTTFLLSPQSLSIYDKWLDSVQERKNNAYDARNEDLKSFLSKSTALPLCYVQALQICDHVDRLGAADDIETIIDAATMERAIRLTEHAAEASAACLRIVAREMKNHITADIIPDGETLSLLEETIRDRLAEQPEKFFTKTELVKGRRDLAGKANAEKFDLVIQELTKRGRVKVQKMRIGKHLCDVFRHVPKNDETISDEAEEQEEV